MVRNAGGRAVDAVRTIVALQTIGNAKTVVVMHHTGRFTARDSDKDISTCTTSRAELTVSQTVG